MERGLSFFLWRKLCKQNVTYVLSIAVFHTPETSDLVMQEGFDSPPHNWHWETFAVFNYLVLCIKEDTDEHNVKRRHNHSNPSTTKQVKAGILTTQKSLCMVIFRLQKVCLRNKLRKLLTELRTNSTIVSK